MLNKTKNIILGEIAKEIICTDPAPMPGEGASRVIMALKEDVKDALSKKYNGEI